MVCGLTIPSSAMKPGPDFHVGATDDAETRGVGASMRATISTSGYDDKVELVTVTATRLMTRIMMIRLTAR